MITTEWAIAWARATPAFYERDPVGTPYVGRLDFRPAHAGFDPHTEILASDIPSHYCRVTPHLYTPEEVTSLLEATSSLRPELRGLTYATLLALLSVTGLRTGEACRLNDADIESGILQAKDSNFGKSRDIPIHETTLTILRAYAKVRDRLRTTTTTSALFITGRGTRLYASNLGRAFSRLRKLAGISTSPEARPTRLHDFLHSFATDTLLDWYRSGEDVQANCRY
ncbi:integrase [Arthrobacter sp. MYb227]|uniref:tyrosine-type recombinase/integrase n=1 Tax=Arthrobacter sp. MYb227 TaxID=1848601 RepID=UPI000CFB40D4|nr:tyrosine-type recombinase/integrase [Arthrobacter sp. MYb227]PQZ92926.1 integrase [Arthrobacter sp. MYb227]